MTKVNEYHYIVSHINFFFLWGVKCVKNDVKRPIYISLLYIYIKRDIYISGVIFIYIWVGLIYMAPIYICSPDIYMYAGLTLVT